MNKIRVNRRKAKGNLKSAVKKAGQNIKFYKQKSNRTKSRNWF